MGLKLEPFGCVQSLTRVSRDFNEEKHWSSETRIFRLLSTFFKWHQIGAVTEFSTHLDTVHLRDSEISLLAINQMIESTMLLLKCQIRKVKKVVRGTGMSRANLKHSALGATR